MCFCQRHLHYSMLIFFPREDWERKRIFSFFFFSFFFLLSCIYYTPKHIKSQDIKRKRIEKMEVFIFLTIFLIPLFFFLRKKKDAKFTFVPSFYFLLFLPFFEIVRKEKEESIQYADIKNNAFINRKSFDIYITIYHH